MALSERRPSERGKGGILLLDALLLVALLSDVQFFCVTDLPAPISYWCTDSNRFLLLVLAAVSLFLVSLRWPKTVFGRNAWYLVAYCLVIVAFAFEESLYTCAAYSGDINQWQRYLVRYSTCILAIPIYVELVLRGGYRAFFNMMSLAASIYSLCVLAESFAYNTNGMILFERMITTDNVMVRGWGLRIYLMGGIVQLAFIYSVVGFFWGEHSRREKIFNAFTAIVTMLIVVTVQQTRAETVALTVAAVSTFFFARLGKSTGVFQQTLTVVVIVFLMVSGLLSQWFGSMLEDGSDLSVTARQYAMEYYAGWFLGSPLFGFGFIQSTSSVATGSTGIAFVSDVGFIGELGQWGLLFLSVYLLFVCRIVYICVKAWGASSKMDRALMLGLIVYVALSSMTLICFGYNCIIRVPITLAVFEYIWTKSKPAALADAN